ncbi:acetate kinase 1 [Candidatus Photodesmus blepharus]|uniref:Acetate kinase n=1 Tax=Candidatus Photodesmus blepharonis TaxID=1179155 RepID=A0A084CP42_9GAMM|nr:acetate kinase [Candidatus Photodesmus blepharus]KEY91571.1 acetate kinase 1 [Candidatus Photodesmus blepharus]
MCKLVLVLNCGSSSLKFAVVNAKSGMEYLTGLAECLYLPEACIKWKFHDEHEKRSNDITIHGEALTFIVKTILTSKLEISKNIAAIGHRIVHGGEKFTQSILITDKVLKGIEECAMLAPLHNPAHVIGIKAAQKSFPGLKNVAVFDTAFHQTMPEESYLYPLPYYLYKEHGIRRYGMHGTSHFFITRECTRILNKAVEKINIISCHLGNGASICAIKNGCSVDTSMGLTPLEGLVMGTRSGDIDPGIIFHLHDTLGYSVKKINNILTKESGFIGLTETVSDCRFIESNYDKKEEASRAMDVFCHRLAKYVSGYTAVLEGRLDAIVFTGGIGENSGLIREMVLKRISILGIKVDKEKNLKARFGVQGVITTECSNIPAMVISTNEELVIAEDTARLASI